MHRIIYDELWLGVVREESRQAYRAAIVRLVQAGADGVVLGCTEIELLVCENGQPGPCLPHHPPARRGAVDASLATPGSVGRPQSDLAIGQRVSAALRLPAQPGGCSEMYSPSAKDSGLEA